MNETELQEFAALHALGALDADDEARFESALAGHPEARAELARFRDVAAALALAGGASARPPTELRERILRAVAGLPQPGAELEMLERAAVQAVSAEEISRPAATTPQEAVAASALREAAAVAALAGLKPAAPPPRVRARILERLTPRVPTPPTVAHGFEFVLRDDSGWQHTPVPGFRFKLLSISRDMGYRVRLVELAAGGRLPEHDHAGSEEVFVLTGNLQTEGRLLGPGDFLHAEPGTHHHELHSPDGCTALLIDRAPALAR